MSIEFVGRQAELALLYNLWSQAKSGNGQVVLISGEAGVGKTSLCKKFQRSIEADEEVRIAKAHCSELFGTGDAYAPFIEVLEDLLKPSDEKRPDVREKVLGIIKDSGPAWLGAIPVVGGLAAAVAETAKSIYERVLSDESGRTLVSVGKTQLFQEYQAILRILSEATPLILLVEDIHWANISSLDLLFYLASRVQDSRLLMICTFRPSEMEVGPKGDPRPAKAVILEMQRYSLCSLVNLSRFSFEEFKALVSVMFRQGRFSGSWLTQVFNITDGNPLFAVSLLCLFRDEGLITQTVNGYWKQKEGGIPHNYKLPTDIESVLFKLINKLDQEMQNVLRYASVQGESFTVRILSRVLDWDELVLYDKLLVIETAHKLIVVKGEVLLPTTVTLLYQFMHTLLHQMLYSSLRSPHRIALHRKIGELLEDEYGLQVNRIAGQVALHFHRGHTFGKAARYYILAGKLAYSLYALDEAANDLDLAIHLIQAHSPKDTEMLVEAFSLLGDVKFMLSRYEEASGQFEAVLALTSELDTLWSIFHEIHSNCRLGQICERTGNFDKAKRYLDNSLSIGRITLASHADERLATEFSLCCFELSSILVRTGQYAKACEVCNEGLTVAKSSCDDVTIAAGQRRLGLVHLSLGNLDVAEEVYLRGLRTLSTKQELWLEGALYSNLGAVKCLQGHFDQGLASFGKAFDLMQRIGDEFKMATAAHNLAETFRVMKQYKKAVEWVRKSLEIHEALGTKQAIPICYITLGKIHEDLGRKREAIRFHRQALRLASEIKAPYEIGLVYRAIGTLLARDGKERLARHFFNLAVEIFLFLGSQHEIARTRELLQSLK